MDEVIMERYLRVQEVAAEDGAGKESRAKDKREKKSTESDAVLAARLQAELNGRHFRESKKRRTAKTDREKRKRRIPKEVFEKNPFHEKLNLSPALAHVLGETQLSRPQAVKALWGYIKRNELQNPNDKREIICDDTLRPIFGDKMTMFSMNKLLKPHLFKSEEVVGGGQVQEEEGDDDDDDDNHNDDE